MLVVPVVHANGTPALSSAVAPSPVGAMAAEIAADYSPDNRYGIWRKGDRIGEHRLRFAKDDGALVVDIESTIRVTMLKIPVFRFEYAAEERWNADGLETVDVRVSENGDAWRTSLRGDDGGALLTGPEGEITTSPLAFATNHWHRGVLQTDRVFNTLTGTVSDVAIEPVGRDTLATDAGDIEYTRYRYSGDIDAESWYDDTGRWVGLAFDGEDGSRIEYRLEP